MGSVSRGVMVAPPREMSSASVIQGRRASRTTPRAVRWAVRAAGGQNAGDINSKTAVSKHAINAPSWSTDTCLRSNERVSLKQGEKLT